MDRSTHIAHFVEVIWAWYAVHKRTLPWRDLQGDVNDRAYRVLVSEIMLQQTQVPRVRIIYRTFLERFPTLVDLARATNADVIHAWRGMGYNVRALRLRDIAPYIIEKCDGVIPHDLPSLLLMKGIGPYTAAAIRNFAFHLPTPCIDTNIRRILHRAFIGPENADGTWKKDDRFLLRYAEDVLAAAIDPKCDGRSTADWHAALMDFGSMIQTKNTPKWDLCPLTERGLMRATPRNWQQPERGAAMRREEREPGRVIGGRYVPNRIIRGRIIEALRRNDRASLEDLGSSSCIDWSPDHRVWFDGILHGLIRDGLIVRMGEQYGLS